MSFGLPINEETFYANGSRPIDAAEAAWIASHLEPSNGVSRSPLRGSRVDYSGRVAGHSETDPSPTHLRSELQGLS